MEELVTVAVQLDAEQAWALAQLVKRIGWADCRSLAEEEEQTRLMIAATAGARSARGGVVRAEVGRSAGGCAASTGIAGAVGPPQASHAM
jgi:hypothetical protein